MKPQEVYDHEMFQTGVLEARFDGDASQADPASISVDAGTLFKTFEPEVACFVNGDYKGGNVLDVQMYGCNGFLGLLGCFKNLTIGFWIIFKCLRK